MEHRVNAGARLTSFRNVAKIRCVADSTASRDTSGIRVYNKAEASGYTRTGRSTSGDFVAISLRLLRAIAVVALFGSTLLTPGSAAASDYFADVSDNAYYAEAADWLYDTGLSTGVAPGIFQPDGLVTRAQIATFLWRVSGGHPPTSSGTFADIHPAAWYAPAVDWMAATGITTGIGPNLFGPDYWVPRAQVVTFLWRASGSPDAPATNQFSDVSRRDYYKEAVDWAVHRASSPGCPKPRLGPITRRHEARWPPCCSVGPERRRRRACAGVVPTAIRTTRRSTFRPTVDRSRLANNNRDYLVVLPKNQAVDRNVRIVGGRNVVIIGGEIRIDQNYSNKGDRMGFKFVDQTGVIYVEGVKIHGDELTEGFQFTSPDAQVVLQNIRIGEMWGGDNTGKGLNHADFIQPHGGLGVNKSWAMRLCRFTAGPSHYNGFMLTGDAQANSDLGPVDIRLTNIELVEGAVNSNTDTGGGWTAIFMKNVDAIDFDSGTVWADHNGQRNGGRLSDNVLPRSNNERSDGTGSYITWSQNWISGRVYTGQPPNGDYASITVGRNYDSYVD